MEEDLKIKGGWQDKIAEAIAKQYANGRTTKVILINPHVFAELIEEIDDLDKGRWLIPNMESTYCGAKIIQTSEIPDFRVIDDKHWYEE